MADIVERLREHLRQLDGLKGQGLDQYARILSLSCSIAELTPALLSEHARQREEIGRLHAALRNAADSLDDVGSHASAAEARSYLTTPET